MNNAFFSVVIPNYNSKYLHRTLESLIKQTFPNWEAIVVDNNSAYNVYNIISNYNDDRLKIYKLENKVNNIQDQNYSENYDFDENHDYDDILDTSFKK